MTESFPESSNLDRSVPSSVGERYKKYALKRTGVEVRSSLAGLRNTLSLASDAPDVQQEPFDQWKNGMVQEAFDGFRLEFEGYADKISDEKIKAADSSEESRLGRTFGIRTESGSFWEDIFAQVRISHDRKHMASLITNKRYEEYRTYVDNILKTNRVKMNTIYVPMAKGIKAKVSEKSQAYFDRRGIDRADVSVKFEQTTDGEYREQPKVVTYFTLQPK